MLYPVSGLPSSPADWRDHFGERWPAFRSAKERFDPGHVLTPGQGAVAAGDLGAVRPVAPCGAR